MEDPTLLAIRNSQDVQRALQSTLAAASAARPKNTRKNYDSKQREWIAWCRERGFHDGCLVTEGKLVLYLEEIVEVKENRTAAEGMAGWMSVEGMKGYVKAIVALWRMQASIDRSLGAHHPRGGALKAFLRTRALKLQEHKRSTYHDRGAGTVQDTYTEEDMRNMSRFFFELLSPRGIRDRLDFLLGHALVARGESTRFIQLPDLFTMCLKNEGPTECNVLMVIMSRGKTNQHGRIDYGGCMRNRDVEMRCTCSIASSCKASPFLISQIAPFGTTRASSMGAIPSKPCHTQCKRRI